MARTVSYENEVGLIGSIFRDPDRFEELSDIVEPEDFGWDCYRWVWESMKSLHERGMGIDVITIGDELQRDGRIKSFVHHEKIFSERNALAKIREFGDPRMAETYASKVKDYSAKRQLEHLCSQWLDWSQNGRTAPQIMQDMVIQLSHIRTFDSKAFEHTSSLADAVSEAYDHTDRASRGLIKFVPTGFKDIDTLLSGGMTSPDLYVIAGRPGTGKTAFLVSVARNAAMAGKRVAIFSLEMENKQIAMRLIAQESGISYDKQKSGKMKDSDWPVYTAAVEKIADSDTYPIILNDMPSISISKMRQELRRMGNVDLLIVDYIQLGGVDGKYNRRDQEIGEITRGLKSIAKEFQIPVFAAAQLSRAVEQRSEKKPILSDLRESGDIENDSDVIMFIYRPNQFATDATKYEAEIIVAKHRNGEVGSVDLVYMANLTRFENAKVKMFRPNEAVQS
jgi:replicative DNA helicase